MLYVEKDLALISMAIFDHWDEKKDQLNQKILYCADARVSPDDVISVVEKCTKQVSVSWLQPRNLSLHRTDKY